MFKRAGTANIVPHEKPVLIASCNRLPHNTLCHGHAVGTHPKVPSGPARCLITEQKRPNVSVLWAQDVAVVTSEAGLLLLLILNRNPIERGISAQGLRPTRVKVDLNSDSGPVELSVPGLVVSHWKQGCESPTGFQFSSFSRMRRYSICPLSPSSPIGPDAGSMSASSRTSPLHVQWATLSLTFTTSSFQSCGRYCLSFL